MVPSCHGIGRTPYGSTSPRVGIFRAKLGRMRRSRGFAILGPAVALVVSACSLSHAPAGTPASPTSGATSSATLATSAASPRPAALPRTSAAGASVTLTAVGDLILGITPSLPPDPATYLEAVEPELKHGAQIVFGNLEGTLTTATASKCGPGPSHPDCFAFQNPPATSGTSRTWDSPS